MTKKFALFENYIKHFLLTLPNTNFNILKFS